MPKMIKTAIYIIFYIYIYYLLFIILYREIYSRLDLFIMINILDT